MLHAHAEDGADLVAHNLGTGRGEAAVVGLVHQLHGTGKVIAAVEAQGSYRDHIATEGIVFNGEIFALVIAEEGDIGGVNTAKVGVQGIADLLVRNTAIPDTLEPTGICKLVE